MGQHPTSVNGIPYDEWVARKTAKNTPKTATVEFAPPPKQENNDDLDIVKTALGLEDDVHLIDVLNAISELMAIKEQYSLGDTDTPRLTSDDSDEETIVEQAQGTRGPDYIDLGEDE